MEQNRGFTVSRESKEIEKIQKEIDESVTGYRCLAWIDKGDPAWNRFGQTTVTVSIMEGPNIRGDLNLIPRENDYILWDLTGGHQFNFNLSKIDEFWKGETNKTLKKIMEIVESHIGHVVNIEYGRWDFRYKEVN